jgi:signal transduction histidine kinase/ActR/RegA family two-component response regulator
MSMVAVFLANDQVGSLSDADASCRRPGLRLFVTSLVLLLSMVLALGLATLRATQVGEQARAEAGAANLQQATGVAAATDADLARFGRDVQAQARFIEQQGALAHPSMLQALLGNLHAQPAFAWSGVTAADGRVLAALDGHLEGVSVAQRDWWNAALRGLYFGDVHEAKSLAMRLPALGTGEPWRFIDIATPLHEGQRVSGVLAVHLSWPWLRERIALFAGAVPGHGAQLFIIGRDGRQRLGPTGQLGDALPLQHLAAEVSEGWRVLTWPDGQRYVTAWAASRGSERDAGLRWITLVRTPLQALEASSANSVRWIWGVAALVIVGATALAWALSSVFLVPLGHFVARVRCIADGADVPPAPQLLPAEFARMHTAVQALVAQLREKEAALRQALEHVRGGFENVGRAMPGYLFTSVQQGQESRYTFFSESTQHYLGVSQQALMADRRGLLWTRHVDEADVRRIVAQLVHAMAEGTPLTSPFRVRGGDDCWRTLQLTMVPRESGTSAERIFDGIAIDITDLVEAREQAQRASKAKSRFLATMSHELRTPMNAILGLTHLLAREDATPRQAAQLDKIADAARHLLSIINDILDLSRIEAGKLQLEERDFELPALLEQVHAIVGEGAAAKDLHVEVDAGTVPHGLRGDETRVRQALVNYAGNAVKFTTSGRIVLRARLLQEQEARLLVRFEVEDTGVGIDPQQLPRLFEAFEQADSSTLREHGGTGLGLAITRHLAELMGGSAGAQCLSGGSLFWFTAWLGRGENAYATAAAVPARPKAELRLRHAGARVLLVEDNFINREVALAMLRAAGLDADFAENGRVALEKARQRAYNLVLMDVHMPVMDGLQATRALRAMPNLRTLPILSMTANVFDADRAACLDAGMDDFVAKPVEPPALYATLLKWLDCAAAA